MNNTMKMITVSDSAGRDTIHHFATNHYDVIGSAKNKQEATALLSELEPDLVALDLGEQDTAGLGCIDEMLQMRPNIKILVLCSAKNQGVGIKALMRGASSFLQKPFDQEQFSRALKTTSTGLLL